MKLYIIYDKEYNPYSSELTIKSICTTETKAKEILDELHLDSGFKLYEYKEVDSDIELPDYIL